MSSDILRNAGVWIFELVNYLCSVRHKMSKVDLYLEVLSFSSYNWDDIFCGIYVVILCVAYKALHSRKSRLVALAVGRSTRECFHFIQISGQKLLHMYNNRRIFPIFVSPKIILVCRRNRDENTRPEQKQINVLWQNRFGPVRTQEHKNTLW